MNSLSGESVGAAAASRFASSRNFITNLSVAGARSSARFKAISPMPDTLGSLTLGADLTGKNNWDAKLQYRADIGSRYQSHTGTTKISYRF